MVFVAIVYRCVSWLRFVVVLAVACCVVYAVCYDVMIDVSCYGVSCVFLLDVNCLLFVIECLLVVVCLCVKLLARVVARRVLLFGVLSVAWCALVVAVCLA